MRARVKATGALLEVRFRDTDTEYPYICDMQGECGTIWKESELEFLDDDPDYWTRLKHHYVGMAMNALLLTNNIRNGDLEGMRECNTNAMAIAHALVEKLKEKEEK